MLYLDSRERGRAAVAVGADGARDAEHRSRRGDRERPPLPRSARARQARSGAQGGGGDSAVAPAGVESHAAPSSRPPAPRSRAARSGGDFFDYVDLRERPVRIHSRRRRRQGRAGGAARGGRRSACSARRRRISRARAARDAAQSRPLPPRHRGALPDRLLRHPRPRRLADLFERRPQRADAGDDRTACAGWRRAASCSASSSTRRSRRRR